MQDDRFEPVWGATAIAEFIRVSKRRAFYLLERGQLPARKVGATWQSTRGELRDFLLGIRAPRSREVA
jgi:hypothetical protein